jgi:hypothetical protein
MLKSESPSQHFRRVVVEYYKLVLLILANLNRHDQQLPSVIMILRFRIPILRRAHILIPH